MASTGDSDDPFDSDSADSERGFGRTIHRFRSVLMHPMGLPLLIYLNDVPSESYSDHHLAYIRDALNRYQLLCSDDVNQHNHVFAATILDWQDGSETELTSKLETNMKILGLVNQYGTTTSTGSEDKVGMKVDKGRIKFLSQGSPNKHDDSASVVSIFQFGIAHENWWRKQDQLLKYVLRDNPDGNDIFDGPILLSVITIDNGMGNLTEQQTLELNLQSNTENKPNIKGIPFEARFGVFLCTPKGDDDFRIALLWRHDAKTLVDASIQFGKVLYAVQLCSYLREYCNENQERIQYKYLGPNCCKFGNLLYRSYDNRLRPTEQRPDLYMDTTGISIGETGPLAESFLEIPDTLTGAVREFGELVNPNPRLNRKEMDTIWGFTGKLLIISTPYREGVHYATHAHHFLPIINQLCHLHRQDLVHGDIRAYNMVLQHEADSSETNNVVEYESSDGTTKQCTGWLIDFDFGGALGEVKYPTGYKGLLKDGQRPGAEGRPITIMDDWKSLISLIFHTYSILRSKLSPPSDERILAKCDAEEALEEYIEFKAKSDDTQLSTYEIPAKLLRTYLDTTKTFTVNPRENFERDLKKCGLWSTKKQSKASNAVSGSSKKGNN